jgi:hypothetical protein
VESKIPKALLIRIRRVVAKHPRTVLEHILKFGFITTEDLKQTYGYNHPPRAARDVREHGISLETYKVSDSTGRKIAAYRLNLTVVAVIGKAGRKQFPRELKRALLERFGSQCAICEGTFDPTFLQIDHRVPFEVAGESEMDNPDSLMLVCGSCNRTKSWACEHCKNWQELKRIAVCQSCYWASPTTYSHVAMVKIRRADVTWLGDEIEEFDSLHDACKKTKQSIQEGIKKAVRNLVKK